MNKKSLSILAGVVALGVAAFLARQAFDRLGRGSSVPPDVLDRAWNPQTVAGIPFTFAAPWALEAQPVQLPPEVQKLVSSMDAYGHQADGLNVMAVHTAYHGGVALNLAGAADGAIASIRSTSGVTGVDGSKQSASIDGQPGYEIVATVHLKRGGPLLMRGVVFLSGNGLCQFILVADADPSRAAQVWDRLCSSIRRTGHD